MIAIDSNLSVNLLQRISEEYFDLGLSNHRVGPGKR